MTKFYPRRLSWKDVIKIRDQKSACFKVIEKIMLLNSEAFSAISDDSELSSEFTSDYFLRSDSQDRTMSGNFDENDVSSDTVHPMDMMNVIYNCCDYILLQTILEKLYLCRLSIPILCYDPKDQSSTFMVWSLRGILPENVDCHIKTTDVTNNEFDISNVNTFKSEAASVKYAADYTEHQLSLADIPQTFLAVFRIGRLQFSKSKMLNELLSTTCHPTFFHRDCDIGTMSIRTDSEGTVEAAWFWPNKNETKSFKKRFTVLNLRGDASAFRKQATWLCSFSNLIVLMVNLENLKNDTYSEYLEMGSFSGRKFVICVVADTFAEVSDRHQALCRLKEIISKHHERIFGVVNNWEKNNIISESKWKNKLKKVIDKYLTDSSQQITLTELAEISNQVNFKVDEDDSACKSAYFKAKQVIESVEYIEARKRKLEVLALQDKPWKKWTQLKKEQYRNKKLDISIEKFIAEKQTEQENARKEQLKLMENSAFNFMKEIYSYLQNNELIESQYFVIWIQLILNDLSRKVMPKVANDYYTKLREVRKKWNNLLDDSTKSDLSGELDILKTHFDNSSFGLEHIFREFGQMYEAEKMCGPPVRIYSRLPSIVAKLLLEGHTFELMDGDSAFVPITWVQAVFNEVKEIIGDKKIFIVSVIGIQSSGKSTLLNTMFGLKFAVSAGRCTKGLYCQMIPIDKESMAINCDYVLVIDTEGLRAPEFQDEGMNRDNELATLVIGLGDVTIVNVKGENSSEMNDILQIAIHAMIRIKQVRMVAIQPSCLFVHQNVSAVHAEELLKIEHEHLLSKLNKITAAAAEQEKVRNIQNFQDVIHFDENTFVNYVPDLWQEQPPMARMSIEYSEKIRDIKTKLTQLIHRKSKPITISEFVTRISDLWEAILHENFVFSFKNSEAVRAYIEVDGEFTRYCYHFKDLCSQLQNKYQTQILSFTEIANLLREKSTMPDQIKTKLTEECDKMQIELKNYFSNHRNREILEQWRRTVQIKS